MHNDRYPRDLRDLQAVDPPESTEPGPAEHPEPDRGREISAWARARWAEATGDGSYWPPAWLVIGGLALAALVVVFGVLGPLVVALSSATPAAVTWADTLGVTHMITAPARAYLTAHAAGVPFSPELLFAGWAAAGLALLAWSALFRSFGARVGWTLLGAGTVAMVYAGTPAPSQTLAAGITALVWAVASIAAFRGVGQGERETVIFSPQPRPHESPEEPQRS